MARFNGEIVRVTAVGRGSTSVVFKAFDLSNNRFVAIKEATSASQRLQAGTDDSGSPLVLYEAQILLKLARCAANTIVECYGVTEQGAGQWALLCEYASYGSLDAWLGRLPDGHISRVAYSVAMALAATHEASLIHCDVKPSNVLLGRSGPKLADFALAGHGGSRGTFQYMAPERLLEPPSSSAAADVWGLGMTLLVARLGSYPATHASIDDFWWALEVYESEDRLDRLTAGARIPGKLKDMLDRCLCFSTAGRPSARDVANHAFAQQRVRLSEWCRPFSVSCPFEQLDAFLDAFREHSKKHEALCSVLALRQTETACLGPTISGEMHSRLGS